MILCGESKKTSNQAGFFSPGAVAVICTDRFANSPVMDPAMQYVAAISDAAPYLSQGLSNQP